MPKAELFETKPSSWHIAAQFARCGYDVSVQYGADQPEYDLIVAKEDHLMKVSVKGSQDWELLSRAIIQVEKLHIPDNRESGRGRVIYP
jgi:hypothetical protein